MNVSDGIALLALLFAVVSFFDGKRSSRSATELIHREIDLVKLQFSKASIEVESEKKAEVSAKIFKEGNNWMVRIFNKGPAEARNVRLVLNEHNSIVSEGAFDGKFPMERMERGSSVNGYAYIHLSSPRKEKLTIQWNDESASNRCTTVELTI